MESVVRVNVPLRVPVPYDGVASADPDGHGDLLAGQTRRCNQRTQVRPSDNALDCVREKADGMRLDRCDAA